MKNIIPTIKGQSAGLFMGSVEIGKRVDEDNVKASVPFAIACEQSDIDSHNTYTVTGTLNQRTNTFHQDSSNEWLNDRFESFGVDFAELIEAR